MKKLFAVLLAVMMMASLLSFASADDYTIRIYSKSNSTERTTWLIEKAKEATKEVAPNINIFEGRVCSGDQFIFNKAQKDLIVANFNGLCCEMEGAAIAHTCYLFGVPFVIIRAISDKPDGEGAEDFNQFASKMAVVSENIVKSMLRRI